MRCSLEYADGVSDQFNFFLVSWDGPGEVMCFREKSREVEGITLDGVKDFKIKLAVEQAILLACCRRCAVRREKLHREATRGKAGRGIPCSSSSFCWRSSPTWCSPRAADANDHCALPVVRR